ncbi:Proteasome subunit alpha type-7 [Cucumispora dikerogammari]|nr:Proteasome subunit alpha type-7 [Cucumispora dikerogammari]
MGFETSTNIFSPDGRLLQLERALISPQLSSNITFSIFENKMCLVFEKKQTDGISFKQIHKVHENVYLSFAGLCPDFFRLKNILLYRIADMKLQEFTLTIQMITDLTAKILQNYSLSSGRPFGLQILVFGFDLNKIKAYIVETDGNYSEFMAGSLGRKKTEVNKFLEEVEINKSSAVDAVVSEVQNDTKKMDIFIIGADGIQQREMLGED